MSSLRTLLFTGVVIALIYLSALHLDFHSQNHPIGEDGIFEEETPLSDWTLPPEIAYCTERVGDSYLENLRDSATEYCTPESSSSLKCFHTDIAGHHRTDTFCMGRNAVFQPTTRKFHMNCQRGLLKTPDTWYAVPQYGHFLRYWYDTGPQVVLDGWVALDNGTINELQDPASHTILVKREGSQNLWHGMMEVFSMAMSLDVLRITQRPESPHADTLLAHSDVKNTQVVLLDDYEDGPYIELWSMLADKPTIRLADMPNDTKTNLIIPLAGASNPFWQYDGKLRLCSDSTLLRTFASRVLDTYHIEQREHSRSDIVITFIQRSETRRLVNEVIYLDRIRSLFSQVTVQAIDFAVIPFREQLQIIQNTDILVGVHGAGLAHTMFLPPKSAMVEIFPPTLGEQVFHNVATLLGHFYFSIHGWMWMEDSKQADWHEEDVFLEESEFTDLISGAVQAIYDDRADDVVKPMYNQGAV